MSDDNTGYDEVLCYLLSATDAVPRQPDGTLREKLARNPYEDEVRDHLDRAIQYVRGAMQWERICGKMT